LASDFYPKVEAGFGLIRDTLRSIQAPKQGSTGIPDNGSD